MLRKRVDSVLRVDRILDRIIRLVVRVPLVVAIWVCAGVTVLFLFEPNGFSGIDRLIFTRCHVGRDHVIVVVGVR